MASIHIDKNRTWVVARGAVYYVLDQLSLSDISPVVAQRVTDSLEHNLGYLFLDDLSPEDRKRFGQEVARIADNLEQAGPESLSTPSIHGPMVKSLRVRFESVVQRASLRSRMRAEAA